MKSPYFFKNILGVWRFAIMSLQLHLKEKKIKKIAHQALFRIIEDSFRIFPEQKTKSNEYRLKYVYSVKYTSVLLTGYQECSKLQANREIDEAIMYFITSVGILDDFYDDYPISETTIEVLLTNPNAVHGDSWNIHLFKILWAKVLSHTNNADEFKAIMLQIHRAQVLSKKQTQKELSFDEHVNIAELKAGYSFHAVDYILSKKVNPNLLPLLNKFGLFIQLTNDLFDVHKDLQAGIYTIFNRSKDLKNERLYYRNLVNEICEKIKITTDVNTRESLLFLFITAAVSEVCFHQFLKLQEENNGVFQPEKYARKQLICDMEKWENKKLWMRYFLKYYRTI
jgi:hypothetical protein